MANVYAGYVHYRMVEFYPAMDDFTKCLAIDPNFAIAFYNRGNCIALVRVFTHFHCVIRPSAVSVELV